MSDEQGVSKVVDLMRSTRIAMLTTTDGQGRLTSRPMATQDVEFDGDVWFITERSANFVSHLSTSPQVNVAYASGSSWVSLAGTAHVVEDDAKLADLWNTFTDAWMEGGPENPENVLIRVDADTAEYWDSPGSKVTQVANLVKTRVTGDRYEADNEVVDL